MIRRPPISPLFPYTPLSRSRELLPFAVPQLEALGELLRLLGVLGEEEPQRVFGIVDAAGGVEPRTEYEPDLTRPDMPELQTDRKSTRLNSSHSQISYAVFCL